VTGYPDRLASDDSSEASPRVLIMTKDGRAVVWEKATGDVYRQGRFNQANGAAIDERGESTAFSFANGTVRTYPVEQGDELATFEAHANRVTALDVSPDGRWIATGGNDGYARLWDGKDGTKRGEIERLYPIGVVSFSRDSRYLLVGDQSGEAVLWELGTERRTPLLGHNRTTGAVAWSPDAKWLATGSHDGTVRMWTLPEGTLSQTWTYPELVFGVAFSPDGSRMITVSGQVARQYEVNGWREIGAPLAGHENLVTSAAYSPDGTRIATASWDRTARVWDADSGRRLAAYTHAHPLSRVMFAPGGSALITVSEAGELRHIPLDSAELLEMAEQRATRRLTPVECQRYLDLDTC
jgi:WD40 repeat protein